HPCLRPRSTFTPPVRPLIASSMPVDAARTPIRRTPHTPELGPMRRCSSRHLHAQLDSRVRPVVVPSRVHLDDLAVVPPSHPTERVEDDLQCVVQVAPSLWTVHSSRHDELAGERANTRSE